MYTCSMYTGLEETACYNSKKLQISANVKLKSWSTYRKEFYIFGRYFLPASIAKKYKNSRQEICFIWKCRLGDGNNKSNTFLLILKSKCSLGTEWCQNQQKVLVPTTLRRILSLNEHEKTFFRPTMTQEKEFRVNIFKT